MAVSQINYSQASTPGNVENMKRAAIDKFGKQTINQFGALTWCTTLAEGQLSCNVNAGATLQLMHTRLRLNDLSYDHKLRDHAEEQATTDPKF